MFKQTSSSSFKRRKNALFRRVKSYFAYLRLRYKRNRLAYRLAMGAVAVLFVGVLLADSFLRANQSSKYDISKIESVLLEEPIQLYADKLQFSEGTYLHYNEGYTSGFGVVGESYAPKFSATFDRDGRNEVSVRDAVNDVEFSLVPQFSLEEPIKNMNRVVQPITGLNATKVFTLKGSAIKEDLVLFEYQQDELEFDYTLDLPENTEARMESDGSIGVYGITPELLGNVSTGTDEDAALLEKLRNNSEKATILFKIPAPFIVESNKKVSKKATSWFSMPDPDTIRVHAANLAQARYPISIDPTVYIETARKLMRGNNESNIDFDTTNELINKGFTTGARFDDWDTTTQLNEARWNGASDVTGGFIYYSGGETAGAFTDTEFTAAGSTTYNVPSGVTEVTIKTWGAGGGGGGASPDRDGGEGGGGGYASTTVTVTPLESLTVYVGGGGGGGNGGASGTNSGNGGGGGGFSGVYRTTTPLIIAAGGGGGGGGNGDTGSTARQPGDDAGAGGGSTGIAGDGNDTTEGGGGGTQSAGGTGGDDGGDNGTLHTGAGGGDGGSNGANQANGGTNDGGDGGTQQNGGGPNKKPGGGGGGGGYYGGGGGGLRDSRYNGGGGGGGGSSYTTGSPTTNAAGSGTDPGNKNDADRGGVGDGGGGGTSGGGGTAGDDGKVIISYSTGSGDSVHEEVFWAQLNDTTGTVDSPNPGDGACVNWCTDTIYDLPGEREGHSMVAYNGFLYVTGGRNEAGTRQSTVWIAKLGANGEPQLWHPTDTDPDNWVYWYADTALPEALANHSVVAYQNKMYILGGSTTGSTGGITTVRVANIEPTGTLDSWVTTGTTVLPSARYGHTVHVYNDYMYLVGGNSSGTLQSSVNYLKLDDDGTMNTWYATESFTDARMTWGGKNTTVYGGYIYLSGGCTAVDGSGYCTTVTDDTQLASINADGTITEWNEILGLTNLRTGHSLSSWRGYIYGIGGCTSQATGGLCSDIVLNNDYGTINQDGDASTVSDSVNIGTGVCTGGDPYDCDTPPLGNSNGEGGQMAGGVVINNGFVYYIGGCRSVGGSGQICTNGSASRTTDTIYYAEIANDGTLRRPATCTGSNIQYAGSWCVDNNNTINGSVGLAAFGYTVFNNTIYAIGGTDGSAWQTDVYRNSLNADGSLNSWTSQTQNSVGLGTTSIGYPYVFTRANPASAGTNPGNLYVIGGCSNGSNAGLDCGTTASNFFTSVYKCNITTTGALSGCTTSGQVQLDAEPGTVGNQGLGIAAGTVYANYVYLIGGQSPNEDERGQVMYAKIDDNNDIVDVDDETAIDNIWETSGNEIDPARRRGMAFGYNGYLYALAGFAVDTGLNDLLFAKIDVSDGSIGTFNTSGVTVNQRWDIRGVVSSGYVYTLGGCSSGAPPATCNSMTATVQTFQLYNNFSGSTDDYTSSSNDFATDRFGSGAAVYNGYLYIAGGCTSTGDCTNATNSVQYAALGDDGSIGSWSATTATLPADRAWGKLVEAGGSLYYVGGQSDTETDERSEVYYATPAGSGDISTWSTASNGLPQARTKFGAAVWNDRIYVTGGLDSSASSSNTIYYSPQLSSGGDISSTWTTEATNEFVTDRNGHLTLAYANNLYVLGGKTAGDASNYLQDVQFTQINSDGSLDPWSFSTTLPEQIEGADGFVVNGYMYVFGGRSATSTCTDNTYISPVSANTSIATGNNPTGIGAWYQTREAMDGGDRWGGAVAYAEGKAYVLGGTCGTTKTGTDRTLYTTLFSQPQIARYSRFIDTDTNVFPNSWLLNGVDNDIGARWVNNYQSSVSASNVSFQETFDQGTNNSSVQGTDDGGTNSEYTNCYSTDGTGTASRTFDNGWSVSPSLSIQYDITGGTGSTGCEIELGESIDTNATRFDRFYVDFSSAPASNTVIYEVEDETGGGVVSQLRILASSGDLALRDRFSTEDTLTLGTGEHRIEVGIVEDEMTVRVFSGSNIHGDTADDSGTITLDNGPDIYDALDFGNLSGGASWSINFDEHMGSRATWVGSAFPEWGQKTNFGDVTLGDVEAYTPLDSAGVDTEFARWYFFSLSIDASATYGYPDDVTRGPTIDDLSLFFTSDPNKRLRHGKTFTGGEKQPLDTPCRQSNDVDCPEP